MLYLRAKFSCFDRTRKCITCFVKLMCLFLHVYLHERVDQPLSVVMCRVRLCKLCDVLLRLSTRDVRQWGQLWNCTVWTFKPCSNRTSAEALTLPNGFWSDFRALIWCLWLTLTQMFSLIGTVQTRLTSQYSAFFSPSPLRFTPKMEFWFTRGWVKFVLLPKQILF